MDGYNTLTINDFRGGIVEQGRLGPRGSFKFGQGLDIRSGENTLKCQQALKKDSSTVVTDLVIAMIRTSDGRKYAFGDTGNVYRKNTGAWELVYDDPDGRISGAVEYKTTNNSYIFYATATKLKRIRVSDAATGTWSAPATVGTLLNSAEWHSMREAIGTILVTDGDLVGIYDFEENFNNAGLRLPTGAELRCLRDRKNLVYLGDRNDTLARGVLFVWDRLADSWLDKEDSQGNGINAIEWFENGAVVQSGDNGQLKYFNLTTFSPFKRVPGTKSAYPGAACIHQELVTIGMNGGDKNGVYTVGRYDANDPRALNLEYVPSHGKLTGTEIGALLSTGSELYVSWKDGSTYGIDVTDPDNKAVGVYESMRMNMSRPQIDKLIEIVKLETKAMPAGTSVELYWRSSRDGADWRQAELNRDDTEMDSGNQGIFKLGAQGEEYEVKLVLTPNGNETPEVLTINSYFTFLDL